MEPRGRRTYRTGARPLSDNTGDELSLATSLLPVAAEITPIADGRAQRIGSTFMLVRRQASAPQPRNWRFARPAQIRRGTTLQVRTLMRWLPAAARKSKHKRGRGRASVRPLSCAVRGAEAMLEARLTAHELHLAQLRSEASSLWQVRAWADASSHGWNTARRSWPEQTHSFTRNGRASNLGAAVPSFDSCSVGSGLGFEHDPGGDSAGLDVGYRLVDLVEGRGFADHACLAGVREARTPRVGPFVYRQSSRRS